MCCSCKFRTSLWCWRWKALLHTVTHRPKLLHQGYKVVMELVCVCVCVCWQANLYSKILVSSSHGRAHIVKSIPHLHCWICSTDFIQNSHFWWGLILLLPQIGPWNAAGIGGFSSVSLSAVSSLASLPWRNWVVPSFQLGPLGRQWYYWGDKESWMRGQLGDQGDGGFTAGFGHFERFVRHSDVIGLGAGGWGQDWNYRVWGDFQPKWRFKNVSANESEKMHSELHIDWREHPHLVTVFRPGLDKQ